MLHLLQAFQAFQAAEASLREVRRRRYHRDRSISSHNDHVPYSRVECIIAQCSCWFVWRKAEAELLRARRWMKRLDHV